MKRTNLQKIVVLGIFFAIFDQLSKWWALQNLQQPMVLTSWFSLRVEQNHGIAWSLPVPYPLLLLLHIGLLVAIPWFICKHTDIHKQKTLWITALVIGGALGNLYDRLFRGFVVDFIAFSFWPVFNLADVFLTVGIFLFVAFYAKIKRVS